MPDVSRETFSLLAVAYSIGLVMVMTAGIYDGPLAEPALLIAALCLGGLALLFTRMLARKPAIVVTSKTWRIALPLALAVFPIITFGDRRLLIDSPEQSLVIRVIQVLEIGLLASYVPALWSGKDESRSARTLRFAAFAGLLIVGGMSVMHHSPTPIVDVFKVHDEGAKALLRGENPYVVLHVEETTVEKHVIGFVYPPTPCLINAVAYALGGDVRWGMLSALLAAGLAMRAIVRRRTATLTGVPALLEDAPALLVWLTPKMFFFLEQSWNDIYPLALLSLALAAHAFGRKYLAAILLGLALSAKQTMIWFVPLALLLSFNRRQWLVYLGVAAATIAPFAVADFFALKRWLVDMFLHYPPKTGTLSALNFVYRHFGVIPKSTIGLVLAAITSAVAAWRAPKTGHAFALAATVAIFAFFFFNIWMCMNNYFFVAGGALLAAALSMGDSREAVGGEV